MSLYLFPCIECIHLPRAAIGWVRMMGTGGAFVLYVERIARHCKDAEMGVIMGCFL